MSANFVVLSGRLTKEPEVRYSGEGKAFAKFTLAVNRYKSGVDYINVTCFGGWAESVEKNGKKGTEITVIGRIQTGSYEKDGKKVYTTDVIVDNLILGREPKEESKEEPKDTPRIPEGFEALPDDLPF